MALQAAGFAVQQVPDVPAALDVLHSCIQPVVVLFNARVRPGGLCLLETVEDEPALRRHTYVLLTAYPERLSAR